jgi:DNA-binding XRE family transcriptional regulator
MSEHTTAEIPAELLLLYVKGQVTAKAAAKKIGISQSTFLDRLRALGIDTQKGKYYCRRLSMSIEQGQALPTGTAGLAAASLYQSGLSTYQLADRVGCKPLQARRLLQREGVRLRPRWYRSVFCLPDGTLRDMRYFSTRVLQLRTARGWSQQRLADQCGLSKTSIGYWERGQEGPSWETVRRLAKILGASLEDLGITWEPLV